MKGFCNDKTELAICVALAMDTCCFWCTSLSQAPTLVLINPSRITPVVGEIKMFWCKAHWFTKNGSFSKCFLCLSPAFSLLQFLRVDQDKECNMECSGTPRKPLCASDGRTFTSRCEFLRAKCRDPQLEVIRGPCKGQVMSHASALPDAHKCAEGVTVETCGLNSFQHNWFECWEDEWGWHSESGWWWWLGAVVCCCLAGFKISHHLSK